MCQDQKGDMLTILPGLVDKECDVLELFILRQIGEGDSLNNRRELCYQLLILRWPAHDQSADHKIYGGFWRCVEEDRR